MGVPDFCQERMTNRSCDTERSILFLAKKRHHLTETTWSSSIDKCFPSWERIEDLMEFCWRAFSRLAYDFGAFNTAASPALLRIIDAAKARCSNGSKQSPNPYGCYYEYHFPLHNLVHRSARKVPQLGDRGVSRMDPESWYDNISSCSTTLSRLSVYLDGKVPTSCHFMI